MSNYTQHLEYPNWFKRYRIALNNQYDGYRLFLDENSIKLLDLSSLELTSNNAIIRFINNIESKESILFLPLGYLGDIYGDETYPSNEPQNLSDSMNNGIDFVEVPLTVNGEHVIYFNFSDTEEDRWYKLQYKIENNHLKEVNYLRNNFTDTGLIFIESLLGNYDAEITVLSKGSSSFESGLEVIAKERNSSLQSEISIMLKGYNELEVSLLPVFENAILFESELVVTIEKDYGLNAELYIGHEEYLLADIFVDPVVFFESELTIAKKVVMSELPVDFAIHKLQEYTPDMEASITAASTASEDTFNAVIDIVENSYLDAETYVDWQTLFDADLFILGNNDLESSLLVVVSYDLECIIDTRNLQESNFDCDLYVTGNNDLQLDTNMIIEKVRYYKDLESLILVPREHTPNYSNIDSIINVLPEPVGITASINMGESYLLGSEIDVVSIVSEDSTLEAVLIVEQNDAFMMETVSHVKCNSFVDCEIEVYATYSSTVNSEIYVVVNDNKVQSNMEAMINNGISTSDFNAELIVEGDFFNSHELPASIIISNDNTYKLNATIGKYDFVDNGDLNCEIIIEGKEYNELDSTIEINTKSLLKSTKGHLEVTDFSAELVVVFDRNDYLDAEINVLGGPVILIKSDNITYNNVYFDGEIDVQTSGESQFNAEILVDSKDIRELYSSAVSLPNIERTLTAKAIQDATITNIAPYTTYNSKELNVGKYVSSAYKYYYSFIEFDLPQIPKNERYVNTPVIEAILSLNVTKFKGSSIVARTYKANGTWKETAINWSNIKSFLTIEEDNYVLSPIPSKSGLIKLDVTELFNNWCNDNSTKITFRIETESSENDVSIYSSETSKGPQLDVLYYSTLDNGDFSDSCQIELDPLPPNFSNFSAELDVEVIYNAEYLLSSIIEVNKPNDSSYLEAQISPALDYDMAISDYSAEILLEQTEKDSAVLSEIELSFTERILLLDSELELVQSKRENTLLSEVSLEQTERVLLLDSEILLEQTEKDSITSAEIELAYSERIILLDSELLIAQTEKDSNVLSEIEPFFTEKESISPNECVILLDQTERYNDLDSEILISQTDKDIILESEIEVELTKDRSDVNAELIVERNELNINNKGYAYII